MMVIMDIDDQVFIIWKRRKRKTKPNVEMKAKVLLRVLDLVIKTL
jgi:hypothetical protein